MLHLLLWEKEKGLLRGSVSTSRRKLRTLTWEDIPDLVTDFWPRMILPPLNKVKRLQRDHKGRRAALPTSRVHNCSLSVSPALAERGRTTGTACTEGRSPKRGNRLFLTLSPNVHTLKCQSGWDSFRRF